MNLPPRLSVGKNRRGLCERWKAFLEGIYQVLLRDVAHGGLRWGRA